MKIGSKNNPMQELYNVKTQLKAVKNFNVSELLEKLEIIINNNK